MAIWTRILPRRPQIPVTRFYSPKSVLAVKLMAAYSTRPSWLKSLLDDTSPAPKLYAWTPSNIDSNIASSIDADKLVSDDLDGRIFILGIGNLGRLYASCLSMHSPRPPITLVVHRKELLSQWIQGPGLEIMRLGQVYAGKDEFQIEWWTEEVPSHGPVREIVDAKKIRNLLVTTKAAVAMPETDRLRGYLDSSSSVVFVQNGMSKLWPPHGQEYLSKRYPNGDGPNILACVTNHGVYSEGPFQSVHASPADSAIGPVLLNENTQQMAPSVAYLTEAITIAPSLNGRSMSRADLWVSQLQKLVVNASINPLTAILRCKNGRLFENPDGVIAQVLDRLLQEASAVLQTLINHPSSTDILASDSKSAQSLEAFRKELTARFSHAQLRPMLYKIGEIVKENSSSMFQDVQAGKKTEVRDFNGWLVETASFLDQDDSLQRRVLDVSCHQAIVDLVESGVIMSEEELGKHILSL
ncbi:ketopantoate reductase PanE/ApbA C terminal domain-containing protein [Trichoderma austrokoningii]